MTTMPDRSPLKPEELAVIFGADADADSLRELDALEATPARRAPRQRVTMSDRLRRLPKWTLFAAGLLLGWLVVGWWVWPVHWTNSEPWEMSTKNQKTFVQLVADRYWTTRDLAQAEDALNGWKRDDVNTLLVALQAETIEVEARQHLDALTQALNLPGGEQSLLTSIFSQDGVIFALIIAALPMLIAVGLVVASRLNAKSAAAGEGGMGEEQEAELEELLADVQLENGGPGPEGTGPADQAANPNEQQPGQQEATDEQKEDQEEEEELVDSNNPLGDLASLFMEEDTSVALLEAMSKGLPEIPADDLLGNAREVLRRFREERPRRSG